MNFWLLMFAAGLSMVGAFFHGVIGGRIYMDNINKSNLEVRGKSLSLVSWHIFTIFLFVGAIAFALAGFDKMTTVALYPLIAINALGALMFVFLGLSNHKELMKLPGAFLMGATAISGYLGSAL